MKILAIFTCFNRKDKTENCIRTIVAGNPECEFTFAIADDGSTDGTDERLRELSKKFDIRILRGNGTWFYSGGMHAGMEYALKKLPHLYDYMLMMNDDVEFLPGSIQNIIAQSKEQQNAVVVGAMRNEVGEMSYGAVKYTSGYKYKKLNTSEWEIPADTFNANCVLVPYNWFEKVGSMDDHYRHSLGDFDYGLTLKKNGCKIYSSRNFVGMCNNNSNKDTWTDTSLKRSDRIRKKESVKGAPTKQWFYFLYKNFGLVIAFKGVITPYIRILLGK